MVQKPLEATAEMLLFGVGIWIAVSITTPGANLFEKAFVCSGILIALGLVLDALDVALAAGRQEEFEPGSEDASRRGQRSDRDESRQDDDATHANTSPPRPWWEVLGVSPTASIKTVKTAYRRKAILAHPDNHGGSHEAMCELNAAYEAAQTALNFK